MDKKCGNCKNWAAPDGRYSEVWGSAGRCNRLKMYDEVSEWRDIDGVRTDCWVEGEIAFVEDASSYSASLYSLPEFGCVLWEEK